MGDGVFSVRISNEEYRITDVNVLDILFEAIKKAATFIQHRPKEQLSVNLDEYPNGIRCDLCLLNKANNIDNDFAGCKKFDIMTVHCYNTGDDQWDYENYSAYEGKQDCYKNTYACLEKKGFKHCLECGEYRTCENCGVGHEPAECNLGLTAEEVTCLIIPYCEVERLDLMKL
jgi:hypothetical protein